MSAHGIDRRKILSRRLQAWVKDPGQFSRRKLPRSCPVCGYEGVFLSVGRPSKWDVRCPNCASRGRHRLMQLYLDRHGIELAGKRVLHFGPEKYMRRLMRANPAYVAADLYAPSADHRLDITAIDRPGASFDAVIAHHVLEHVDDDAAAMRELCRVLAPAGMAFLSVPINLTRPTYENPAVTEPWMRFWHFNGTDHRRFYGSDFPDRLRAAGFAEVETFRLTPAEEVAYGIDPTDCLFIAR